MFFKPLITVCAFIVVVEASGTAYLLRRPFKNIKLVGNEWKGLRTNFPKRREATNQIILSIYLIYHFTKTIL
jgi:flagellar motor component MotA